jgi:dihydroorotase
LPRNSETITLQQIETAVPATLAFGEHTLVPLRAGETVKWKLAV